MPNSDQYHARQADAYFGANDIPFRVDVCVVIALARDDDMVSDEEVAEAVREAYAMFDELDDAEYSHDRHGHEDIIEAEFDVECDAASEEEAEEVAFDIVHDELPLLDDMFGSDYNITCTARAIM